MSEDCHPLCIACCSRKTEQVESVAVEELANAWAPSNDNEAVHKEMRSYVLADLGTELIELWRCAQCGLEFAQPMKSWSDEHYPPETHSLGYDHQLALAELTKLPRMRILEIGCADGQFLELASQMGHGTTGIDFSSEDVLSARRRGVDAHVCDFAEIHKISSKLGKFDLIALFQVIEHLREPVKVFREIIKMADRDAVMMVGCPSHLRYTRTYKHPQRIGRSDFWDYPPQHLLRWTPESLSSFLQQFNFQTERVVYEPMPIVGAMAHLTALQGLNSTWYEKRWRRRLVSLQWMIRLSADRLARRSTGIRLFVKARLKS